MVSTQISSQDATLRFFLQDIAHKYMDSLLSIQHSAHICYLGYGLAYRPSHCLRRGRYVIACIGLVRSDVHRLHSGLTLRKLHHDLFPVSVYCYHLLFITSTLHQLFSIRTDVSQFYSLQKKLII